MKEIWRPIPSFDGYEASNLGKIRSTFKVILKANGETYTRQPKILKPALNKSGYMRGAISIDGFMRSFMVHRLIAEAFIPNPENKETVNHINGIKTDNRVENLEWNTRSENCQHSFDIGLQKPKRGELNGSAKLTDADVLAIRAHAANSGKRFYGRKELAEKYGVSVAHIKDIVTKRRNIWGHI